MSDSLSPRFDFLRSTQNADGGWGFFPGKQSWLEPTAYALIAIQADRSSQQNFERGWRLMRSWQLPDGSWRPCAAVAEPHWTTSLCVTLHALRGVHDEPFERGVRWLLDTSGIENGLRFRFAHFLSPSVVDLDPSLKAWPWRPGNSSWIEPTAHALVALKKATRFGIWRRQMEERIQMGEKMILERRCSDGGWNYGNRKVLKTELPSYPETTALALLGLAGNSSLDLAGPISVAKNYQSETRSPLAKAWLAVALRSHAVGPVLPDSIAANDTLINALEVIAATGVLV
jgi:hypothetical protein